MDQNPFQQFSQPPQGDQPPQQPHHQPHHQAHHPHHQQHEQHQPQHQYPQPPTEEQAPPPPPPIPTFNQNFASAPAFITPEAPQPPQFPQSPIAPAAPAPARPDMAPQPVVQVFSPHGIEYVFQTLSLLTGALGLLIVLLSLVNGETGFEVLGFPVAMLLVSLPLFAGLFLRLKNAELRNPALRLDASKRRTTQVVQIVTFLTCLFSMIALVAIIFAKIGGSYDGSIFKAFVNVLIILLVAGGILTYYWREEHRS